MTKFTLREKVKIVLESFFAIAFVVSIVFLDFMIVDIVKN